LAALLFVPVFGMLLASESNAEADEAQSSPQLSYDLQGVGGSDEELASTDLTASDLQSELVFDPSNAENLQNVDNRVADASPDDSVARPASAASDSIDGYEIKRIFEIDGPFEHGDWVWDEAGAPKDGKLLVSINLDAQTLSVYRGGFEIGTAVILYGADEKPTPTGKFTITQKNKDHISNLYFVPMPYMMRLTNDGIAIHGSEVEYGYATHGCVGVPDEFAAKLFAIAQLGTDVVIKAS